MYDALVSEEPIDTKNPLFQKYQKQYKFITFFDDLYPKHLRNIDKPPLILFYKGNIKLLLQANKL